MTSRGSDAVDLNAEQADVATRSVDELKRLRAMLAEGLASGEAMPFTDLDWDEIERVAKSDGASKENDA